MQPSEALATYAATTRYEDLPEPVAAVAKLHLADTLGCALVGGAQAAADRWWQTLRFWGGEAAPGDDSYAFAADRRMPLLQAAAFDSYASRVWDFDNVHDPTGDHPSVAVVPAVLALCGNRPLPGRDLLAAIVVGEELQLRIRLGSPQRLGVAIGDHPWTTGTYAPLGAAVGCARLLGLDAETTLAALGTAYTECSNTVESQFEGRRAHRVHQGMATAAGVQSALLAADGLDSIRRPLEGPYGYYRTFHGASGPSDVLLDDLGSRFHMSEVAIKPYPACRLTHSAIRALDALRRERDFAPEEVARAVVRVGGSTLDLCAPEQRVPDGVAAAQFNLPYIVALVLARQGIELETMRDVTQATSAPVARLLELVELELQQDAEPHAGGQVGDAEIEIGLRDGTTLVGHDTSGDVGADEVATKFRANCRLAGLSAAHADDLWAAIDGIEASDDAGAQLAGIVRGERADEGVAELRR